MRHLSSAKNILNSVIRFELACLILGVTAASELHANDVPEIKIGGKLQVLYSDTAIENDEDIPGKMSIRRARFKIEAKTSALSKVVLQTNYTTNVKSGAGDLSIIDAYLAYDINPQHQITLGQHMAPALRQNITQAGALLAIDRPALTFKAMSWGARSKAGFTTLAAPDTDAGLRSATVARDQGGTLLGNYSRANDQHWKLYLGAYNGVKDAQNLRYTGRLQFNFGDSESSYYNSSYYRSEKNTVSLGLSYDRQNDVAVDAVRGEAIDYQLSSIDVFTQKQFGPGSLNFEAAYIALDLEDAELLNALSSETSLSDTSASATQGNGYYLQAAYTLGAWQPWMLYERWSADDIEKRGSFESTRIGFSYFFNAPLECKLGLEKWRSMPEGSSVRVEEFTTLAAGLYMKF